MCGRYLTPLQPNPGSAPAYKGELPERARQPDCGYYLKTGTYKFGSACKYHHPRDRHGAGPVLLNSLGLPMRQEENPCLFYLKTGSCKFGASCKFDHPQLASTGTALAVPPPAAYGSPGLSVLPSSGHLYGRIFKVAIFKNTILTCVRCTSPPDLYAGPYVSKHCTRIWLEHLSWLVNDVFYRKEGYCPVILYGV
ncbi:zinc finger CCCH domain-containing protein 57-like [Rhododendron vialii]|uniref:zinc finger CCCH domain-containing protein 57-like n=1 Tax=Rhododendron vialii TaxID=182163 RepID=UPI00265ED0ED|nr:zinc finger CCCH domain-containing protein 57-like [Rhododendron vialii]